MEKIKFKANDGTEKELDVLFTFNYKEDKYVTYTDYEKDNKGNIKCYSSCCNDGEITPIENNEIYLLVDEILNDINKDLVDKFVSKE